MLDPCSGSPNLSPEKTTFKIQHLCKLSLRDSRLFNPTVTLLLYVTPAQAKLVYKPFSSAGLCIEYHKYLSHTSGLRKKKRRLTYNFKVATIALLGKFIDTKATKGTGIL
ncbi:hypothetical protein TWF103_010076 [Orbilia oligospora]|nr:hypothetical protein TWF103_010076 [Orbilia oligospora]